MATKDQKDQQPQEQPSEDQQGAQEGTKPVTYIVNGIEVDPNGQPVKGGK